MFEQTWQKVCSLADFVVAGVAAMESGLRRLLLNCNGRELLDSERRFSDQEWRWDALDAETSYGSTRGAAPRLCYRQSHAEKVYLSNKQNYGRSRDSKNLKATIITDEDRRCDDKDMLLWALMLKKNIDAKVGFMSCMIKV
jgi:hypothetical protein